MKQNYFVYNGRIYNSGTIIVLSSFNYMAMKVCNEKAKFLWYDTNTKEYGVEIYGKEWVYKEDIFKNNLVNIYEQNKKGNRIPQKVEQSYTFSDELNIDSLLIAWVWYIFVMIVGIIFYDVIGIWILASYIFFSYRNKKLKEAGYK